MGWPFPHVGGSSTRRSATGVYSRGEVSESKMALTPELRGLYNLIETTSTQEQPAVAVILESEVTYRTHLTPPEARQVAAALTFAADTIDGQRSAEQDQQ